MFVDLFPQDLSKKHPDHQCGRKAPQVKGLQIHLCQQLKDRRPHDPVVPKVVQRHHAQDHDGLDHAPHVDVLGYMAWADFGWGSDGLVRS